MNTRFQDIKMKSSDKEKMELINKKYNRSTFKKIVNNKSEVDDLLILNVLDMEKLKIKINELVCNIDGLKHILKQDVELNIQQINDLNYLPAGTEYEFKHLKIINKYFSKYNEILVAINQYLSNANNSFYNIKRNIDEIIEGKKQNLNAWDIWNFSLGYEMLVEVSYYIEKIKEQENDYKTQDSFNISKVKRYYNAYELELTKDDKPYGLSLYTSYYNRIMKNYNMIVGLDKTSQEFNMDKDKKIYEYVKDFIDYKY